MNCRFQFCVWLAAALIAVWLVPAAAVAQFPSSDSPPSDPSGEQDAGAKDDDEKWPFPDPPGATRLSKKGRVWIDLKKKQVIVDGEICNRRDLLEMFACPKNTKEHESIVAVHCRAQTVHAGLLAIGAKPGSTVKFDPKYIPASGDVIEIYVLWIDKDGKQHKAKAQEWVRHVKTKKQMKYDWVFGGSGIYVDPSTKQRYYLGDDGYLVCVANFSTATMDLPVESAAANAELLYEPFKERIPPRHTKVRLVFQTKKPAKNTAEKLQD